jgi:hypothetical protein
LTKQRAKKEMINIEELKRKKLENEKMDWKR